MEIIEIKNWFEISENFTGKTIYDSGDVEYLKNGLLHRDDGLPAVEYNNGDKEYHVEGKLHRIGGPAVEYGNNIKEYWVNGKRASKEAHDLLWNLMKLKEKIVT